MLIFYQVESLVMIAEELKKEIAELKAKRKKGALIKTLMDDYSLSKTSVYRYLRES